jgi:predicted Zn-dependent peptidase
MMREMGMLSTAEVPFPALRGFVSQFALERLGEEMTSESQAEALGRAALYFGDHHMAEERWERLRRVGPGTIRRVAERYMRDVNMAFLGDTSRMQGRW